MGFGSILSLGRGRGNRESPTNAFISAFMAGKRLKLAQDEEERGKRLDELTEERLKLQLQEIKQRQKFAQNEQERATLESQRQDALENIALLEGRPGPSMADVLMRNQISVPSGPLTPEIQISPKEFRGIQTPHEPIRVPGGQTQRDIFVQPRTDVQVKEEKESEAAIEAQRDVLSTFNTEIAKQTARSFFPNPGSLKAVKTVDENGNAVTRFVSPKLGEEFPAAPTTQERNEERVLKKTGASIQATKALGESIITKTGIKQRGTAIARAAAARLGNDPEFRAYQDARIALAGNLAVLQQGSRPSDADIRAVWLPLVPNVFEDTVESAKLKWDLIRIGSGIDVDEPISNILIPGSGESVAEEEEFREGDIVENPETGERLILRNKEWVPIK